MRVTYYALKPLNVGGQVRQEGDLVPEAAHWPYLSGYIADGRLAPVLVATLPEEQQMVLLEWEEQRLGALSAQVPSSDDTETTEQKSKGKVKV